MFASRNSRLSTLNSPDALTSLHDVMMSADDTKSIDIIFCLTRFISLAGAVKLLQDRGKSSFMGTTEWSGFKVQVIHVVLGVVSSSQFVLISVACHRQ